MCPDPPQIRMSAPDGYVLRNGELQGPPSSPSPASRPSFAHRASTTPSPPPRPLSPPTATPCQRCSRSGTRAPTPSASPPAPPPSPSRTRCFSPACPLRRPVEQPLTPTEEDICARFVVEKEKIRALHPCARKARRVSAEVWLEWFESRIRPGEEDELRRLGFLAYWLAFFVTTRLRPKGSELPERVFALATQISLGQRVALGPVVVVNLYAEMDRIVTTGLEEGASGRVYVWAPLWLLQVWMWERYHRLQPPELKAPESPLSNVRALYWSRRKRKTT
ncbi:hypothetical protein D1007_32781 [Hordeum vulgare]|nr:hypothetical protein D1007_32781 [Hordeum vulgare]